MVINFEPSEPGAGFVFEDKIVGGVIPREFIKPVEAGIREALENGVLAGYPMVDVKATLVFGSYHDVDSSEMAFKIAGSMAVKEAARKANPILLEPVMEVEVVTPVRLPGRRDRRPLQPPRQDRRHDPARATRRWWRPTCRWPRCSGTRPAPQHDAGAGGVLDAVRSLRGSAEDHRGADHHEGEGLVAMGYELLSPVVTHSA